MSVKNFIDLCASKLKIQLVWKKSGNYEVGFDNMGRIEGLKIKLASRCGIYPDLSLESYFSMKDGNKNGSYVLYDTYGKEIENVQKIEKRRDQFRRSQKHSKELNSSSDLERSNTNSNG